MDYTEDPAPKSSGITTRQKGYGVAPSNPRVNVGLSSGREISRPQPAETYLLGVAVHQVFSMLSSNTYRFKKEKKKGYAALC